MSANPRLAAAQRCLARKWQPIPVPARSKAPTMADWPNFRVHGDAANFFPEPGNVGILLGEPSGGLVDIDLDAAESLALAPHFLPKTEAIFGRSSKSRSHFLYVVDSPPVTTRFCDIDGASLVELRSTGSQTIFPPSTHPSGETIAWDEEGEAAKAEGSQLFRALQHLAAATSLVRHYPAAGSRHDLALALSGALVRAGWSTEQIADFIRVVAEGAGDPETRDRARAGDYSAQRIASERPATGWARVEKLIGRDVTRRLRDWLQLNGQERPGNDGPKPDKESQATILVDLVSHAEFFHAVDQSCYATIPIGSHVETWPIRSNSFRRYIAGLFYRSEAKAAGSQAIQDALNVIEARALFDSPERDFFCAWRGRTNLFGSNWAMTNGKRLK